MIKTNISNQELVKLAKSVSKTQKLSKFTKAGEVGCALLSDKGNIYTGVSIDAPCGIGFCAEHGAIASMITNRESRILKIVATTNSGKIISPCGRCREMIYTVNKQNKNTEIILNSKNTKKLKELLPEVWQEKF